MKRTILTSIVTLVAAATLSSCLTPGKYRLYRVANAKSEKSPGCYPNGQIPPNEISDSTTFKTGATFAIYAADSDVFYLDMDTVSVEGEKDGVGAYKFEGKSVDVEPVGQSGSNITTTILTVKLDKSGRKVSGTSTQDVQIICSGDQNCPPASQCVTKTKFEGSEIEGADLQHDV